MPLYDVAAVAEALDIDPKQLDNLLSRHEIPGVTRGRRGVPRRLTPAAALSIRLALILHRALDVPLARAIQLSTELERASGGAIQLEHGFVLSGNIVALRESTGTRLDGAVESLVKRPRGRPPRRRRVDHR